MPLNLQRMTKMTLPLLLFKFGLLLRVSDSVNLDASRPIIYEMPDEGGKDGYFGMSVAIRPKAAFSNESWTIQVGAPRGRGNGNDAGEPGTVYRCPTYGPCRMFAVDEGLKASGGWGPHEYQEKKNAAWIGVAMDIESFGSHEISVVCGHRWMNQNLKNPENIDVTYLVTGVCYVHTLSEGTSKHTVRRLLPLLDKDKIYTPKPYVIDLSTYHWGLGQAGISVRLTRSSPDFLLIGAPGVTHWIGSVIRYDENWNPDVGNFARTEISRRNRYPYLGYSVAFGRFYQDGEYWYAAGAPRSANYHGEVYTFRFKGSSNEVRIGSALAGATFGEYFGSALATGDLNGDGFDDLIVGAPLFSDKDPDEGRIYVYLGTGRGSFLVSAQVVNGRANRGRFGYCVASAEDFDQDGYEDVVVGAPYEDDKKGAVYIYRGFSQGLQTDHGQRIRAMDIHPHLRGFGVSISRAADVDGNNYLDVVVGSYLSGHVVLMRSRPVISLHSRIKTENASLIDRRASHFNVTVCSRFEGSNPPDHVDIVRLTEVDPIHGRGQLDPRASSRGKIIRLRANQIICEVLPILLNASSKNFSPLQIIVKTEIDSCAKGKGSSLLIKEEKAREKDDFPKNCPLGRRGETSKEIPFAGICGSDFTCRSDLEIFCSAPDFREGVYVLGSSEFSVLSMEVKNRGEPAYNTKIKIWSNLKLKRRNSDTPSEAPGRIHWLNLEGILTEEFKTDFWFQIDLNEAESKEETYLNLAVEIFTSSLEANLKNNRCQLSVKLQTDESLNLFASSSPSSAYLTRSALRHQTLNVTHYYEVQKGGITPMKDIQLTIYVPVYFKKELLTFEVEAAEWIHFSQHNEKSPVVESDEEGFDEPMKREKCPPTNRTLFLNCSTAENECEVLRIFFTREILSGFSSYIKIMISLNVTALDSVKIDKDIVHLSTAGSLKFSRFFSGKATEVRRSASTSLYDEEREVQVDAHVIALSILAGGFLLSLMVTGLVKSNFFRRAKKQELKALKDADASFVYFATGIKSERSADEALERTAEQK